MSWDNLTDAQLEAMTSRQVQLRMEILIAVARDRKGKPDFEDADRACNRAVAAWCSRNVHPEPLLLAGLESRR